jgi:hypothetical protein
MAQTSRRGREVLKRLGAVRLSEYLIAELAADGVNLARVAALLEYGRDAAQWDTPAARRRELEEARVVLRQLKLALKRAHRWYSGHVDYLQNGESPVELQRRPVYWAVLALRELLKGPLRDPLVRAAAQTPMPPSRQGRPDRPWLREIREGLAETGCSEDQIIDILKAAGFFSPKSKI